MNMSANVLGLDNATTPLGLKAMKELQGQRADVEKSQHPIVLVDSVAGDLAANGPAENGFGHRAAYAKIV